MQLAQRWSPFGEFLYDAAACDSLLALADVMLVPMMVATPAAQLVSCNRERRDNSVEPIRVMALSRSDLHEKGIVRLEALPPRTKHHDDEERRSYK